MDPLLHSLTGDLSLQGEAMRELQNEMLMNIYSFFTDYYMDGFVTSVVLFIWLGWIFENEDADHFYTDAISDRVITCSAPIVFFLKYLNWPLLNVLRTFLHITIILFSFTYNLGPLVLWCYNNRTGNKQQQCPKNEEQQRRITEDQARRSMSREGSALQREGSRGAEEHRENQLPTVPDNEVEARMEDHEFAAPSDTLRLHSRSRSRSARPSAQPDTPKRRKSNRESPLPSPRRSQRIRTPTKQE